ncbi:MAG TPA: ABC transporter permease, partial [Vicinamibacterales bacterium]
IVEGSKAGYLARYNLVAANYFEAFDVPVILGRGFTSADAGSDRVVVNRTMAERVFAPGNPLGRRFKYVGRSREAGETARPMEHWFEVVGVVPDFPVNVPSALGDTIEPERRIYHAAAIEDVFPVRIAIRVRGGDPAALSGTLRTAAVAANPDLRVANISTYEMKIKRDQGIVRMIGVTVGVAMSSVIILSAAGIYALMSFTVARRRREIGIRAALGANRNRLLAGIFSRVFAQLGAGAALGMIGAVGVGKLLEGDMLERQLLIILPMVVVLMSAVGLLAAMGPARQGLSIQPTEALREE